MTNSDDERVIRALFPTIDQTATGMLMAKQKIAEMRAMKMTSSKEGTGEPMSPCGHHFGDPDALCNCPCPACTKAGTGTEPETGAVACEHVRWVGTATCQKCGEFAPPLTTPSNRPDLSDLSSPAAAEAVEPKFRLITCGHCGGALVCPECTSRLGEPTAAGGDVDADMAFDEWWMENASDYLFGAEGADAEDIAVDLAKVFKAGVAFGRGEGNE